MISTYTKRFPG